MAIFYSCKMAGNRIGNHVSLSLWFCHGDRFISTFNSQMAEEISGEKVFFNHLIISFYFFSLKFILSLKQDFIRESLKNIILLFLLVIIFLCLFMSLNLYVFKQFYNENKFYVFFPIIVLQNKSLN